MTVLNAPLKELATALAQKKISSVELTKLFLNRIEKLNPALNAFITVDAQKSLAHAHTADEHIAKGGAQPLAAIPVPPKALLPTHGCLAPCASTILSDVP